MALRTSIIKRFKYIVKMGNKENFNVRIPPATLVRVDALIEKGVYHNRTDFVNQAMTFQLQKDEFYQMINEQVKDVIRSGEGKEVIKECLKELIEELNDTE